ncbi:MAG: UPF0280 family protein [Candidatus Altiarchaeota archaeon]
MESYSIDYRESHLKILSDVNFFGNASEELERIYDLLGGYLKLNKFLQVTYEPVYIIEKIPPILHSMVEAGNEAGVGPMAAVAGAISEHIGKFILEKGATEVVVENGGDIFLSLTTEKKVGIHAGPSPLSDKLAFQVLPEETPVGICTSSASVGHSISLGEADAVTCIAKSTPLADAAATAVANEVKGENGIEQGLKKAKKIKGITGVLIIQDDVMASWGKLPEIVNQ